MDYSKQRFEDSRTTTLEDSETSPGFDYRMGLVNHVKMKLEKEQIGELTTEDYRAIGQILNERYDGVMEEEVGYGEVFKYFRQINEDWNELESVILEELGGNPEDFGEELGNTGALE